MKLEVSRQITKNTKI